MLLSQPTAISQLFPLLSAGGHRCVGYPSGSGSLVVLYTMADRRKSPRLVMHNNGKEEATDDNENEDAADVLSPPPPPPSFPCRKALQQETELHRRARRLAEGHQAQSESAHSTARTALSK